ncbi:MAG: SGNH/GDSL hydrolase family protein [Leptospiraceae bacterium]|nr:SGNH/GDSL hydrolase family protein [Leptospiraceae bacterium]
MILRILPSRDLLYRHVEKQNHCLHSDKILVVLCENTKERLDHPEGFSFWVTTNSLGERITPNIKSEQEIWVIGDSISMGYGIDDQKSFPYLLSLESGWKVRNLAVDSLGSAGIYQILSEKLKSSKKPNIIFWIFSPSDFVDDPRWLKLKTNLVYRAIFVTQFIAGKYLYSVNFGKYILEKLKFSYKVNDYKNSSHNLPETNHITFEYINKTIWLAKQNQIPIYILLYPDRNLTLANAKTNKTLTDRVADWIQTNGGNSIDLEKAFQDSNTNYYLPEGHPNEKAALLFTQFALEIIKRHK